MKGKKGSGGGCAEIWKETWEVIRRYPELCLPVIWASALAYGWEQLRLILVHQLPFWLLRTHSVLGGVEVAQPGSIQYSTALAVLGLTSNFCLAANTFCFSVALTMTAKMLQRYVEGESSMRLVSWRLVKLSIGFHLTALALSVLILPLASFAVRTHRIDLLSQRFAVGGEVLVMSLVLSYLFAPACLRIVAREYGSHVEKYAVTITHIYAALTAIALTVLTVAITQVHLSGSITFLEIVMVQLFLSILSALPYIPLFVAMGLLGLDGKIEDQEPIVPQE